MASITARSRSPPDGAVFFGNEGLLIEAKVE
jgi:hypothetical protein